MPGHFYVRIPKQIAMFSGKKKKQAKEKTKKGLHDEVMRARYAAIMMGKHVTAGLFYDDRKEKRRIAQGSGLDSRPPRLRACFDAPLRGVKEMGKEVDADGGFQ